MLPAACTLVAHASKASRAKRSAAGIVTPFVSCASTDHGDEQHYAAIHNNFPLHSFFTILRLTVQHTLYIHNHPCNSVRIFCDSNEHKLWSTNDGLPSLRSFRRCCKTRPQQHTTMCREHLNRTDHHNLCMRMQRTAQALLCGAKHDCTMNALRTGHSQQKRQGSRPHGDDTDTQAGPIDNMPSAWPQSSCRC